MALVIVLDSGPLGLACGRRGRTEVADVTRWRHEMSSRGALLVVPEIADYEVRRELIRSKAGDGLGRLDELCREHFYLPLSTGAMRNAAEFWARARDRGLPTAEDRALDGDVILAAQAIGFIGLRDQLVVATDNVRHLARFLDARPWYDIWP